ncbi:MAG: ATP-dependent Clp protease ATP-binding subunit, partial [Paludibacteraceae bacterium]|nr:ATP-dependent Clp protease ATP-binding subunit [Paludibacteraceae bacterium]
FAPEFLNRIDQVITFHQLDNVSLRKILDLELSALSQRLKQQDLKLDISDQVKVDLLSKTETKDFGARPIRRSIQTYLEDKITEQLLGKRKIKTIKIQKL